MSPTSWPTESELYIILKCCHAERRLLIAYAEYNLRLMEALENSIGRESDVPRLRAMRQACTQFRQARGRVLERLDELEAKLQQSHVHIPQLVQLGQGEQLDAKAIRRAWQAVAFLLQQMPIDMAMQIGRVPVTAEARAASCFVNGLQPTRECEPAPRQAHHLITLINWLKSKLYVPRVGSPAWKLLLHAFEMIRRYAAKRCVEHDDELRRIEQELAPLLCSTEVTISAIPEPKEPPR